MELADLMDKLRRSQNFKLTYTKNGKNWTLMERGDLYDAGSTHCIFTDGEHKVDEQYFPVLYKTVKEKLNIDFVEGTLLADWQEA